MTIDHALLDAYRYARHKMPRDEDAPGEFVLIVEPVLRRLFAKWEDRGIPIDHAVAKVIRLQLISLHSSKAKRSIMQAAIIADDASSGVHIDPEVEESPQLPTLHLGAERLPLYFAALSCPELPESHLLEIARAAGVSASEALRDRVSLEVDDDRAGGFRERRDYAYARLLTAQWGLSKETDAARRDALWKMECRARKTLAMSRRRLAACKARASHAEIARVIGIPKGTIDSSLWWLQRKMVMGGKRTRVTKEIANSGHRR